MAEQKDQTPPVVVREVGTAEWRAVAGRFADHNYEQCADYAQRLAARSGSQVRFLTVDSGGEPIGGAAVRIKSVPLLRRGVAYITGGPLWRNHTREVSGSVHGMVLGALREALVGEAKHILLVRPGLSLPAIGAEAQDATPGFGPAQNIRHYRTVVLDLAQNEAAIRAAFHQRWRNYLNQSTREGLIIARGTDPQMRSRFLKSYAAMSTTKSFESGIDPEFFLDLDVADTGIEIFMAEKNGEDAGGLVISLLGDTAVYVLGATNGLGRDTKAGYLLQWTALLHAKAQGCRWYDLCGIDADSNPGGAQFKTKMGGQIVEAPEALKASPGGLISAGLEGVLRLLRRNR